jgi:P-type Cu+ transporter
VDSIVVEGVSAVDESMVTGESLPITKKTNDHVIGGTINTEGALLLKTLNIGSDTFLSQVVSLVEDAMGRKPPMQKMVDKIAGYFSFIVIGVAITNFLAWYFFGAPGLIMSAIIPTVAILVVACPCALGLATPTAIMVGMGKAAQNGVIFKSGFGLEMLGKVQTIIFDKTGTLTEGKPVISDIVPIKQDGLSLDESEILRLAAIAEKNSEHPLSKSVVKRAKEYKITVTDPDTFKSIPGGGVRATFENKSIVIGNPKLFEKEQIEITSAIQDVTNLQEQGKTVSIVVLDNKPIGIISFLDVPKKDSKETVSLLKKMGIEVVMLTGDNEKTAKTIGKSIGIENIISNVVPSEKVVEVKKIQDQGKIVAMVGDGINDAPALTQSDVGIAIGGGTDIALEAGMVILMRDTLKDVVSAVEISKKIINKIKQNLFYAFAYNVILIPVAGTGLLYPALAGLAMAASSVSVVSSSLLLKRWTPPSKSNEG